jgi:hypothetical protein
MKEGAEPAGRAGAQFSRSREERAPRVTKRRQVFAILAAIGAVSCASCAAVAQTPPWPMNQETEHIVLLFKEAVSCVRKKAFALVTSREAADIAARAAVGLCGSALTPYRGAVRSWTAMTSAERSEAYIRQQESKLVDMALTIIVRERMRPSPPPAAPAPKKRDDI